MPGVRRSQRRLLAAAVAVAAAIGVVTLRAQRDLGRLNVVLITIDTLRADHVGAYGYARAVTPHLDALARRGARFDQAITHVPLTFPSHVSLLTGRLPVTHGVRDNGSEVLDPRADTVASHLRAVGYDTAAFVSSFILSAQFGLDKGFDVYDDRLPSRGPLVDYGVRRGAPAVAAAASAWIANHTARPFFLWGHI
jgi:choline-sulfatase